MIKYIIQTSRKTINEAARDYRDGLYKPVLKGMHCRKCQATTTIEFVEDGSYCREIIKACCPEFETRIRTALSKAASEI